MKKHLRPWTKPNHTEQEMPVPYQGTHRFSQILCRPQISSYHMQSYFGRMISTEWPRISSSRLSPNTTSASPPTLATGASSADTITMYMADRMLALLRCFWSIELATLLLEPDADGVGRHWRRRPRPVFARPRRQPAV